LKTIRSALLVVFAVIAFNPAASAQAPVLSTETLRANIQSATERKQSPEEVGKLWLLLANRYRDRFELDRAGDAYAHAIHLLGNTSSQSNYAESLYGIGDVYVAVGRLREARKCLTKSLDIYTTLNDEANMVRLHLSLGSELLAEHKYREAEVESTAAIESGPDAYVSDVSMAYLTRSRAVCAQGRCRFALDDVSKAHSLVLNRFQENSIEMISIWLVQGQIQMKVGLEAEGQKSMEQALRLVQSRTDLPMPYLVALELVILRTQRATLKAAHRKEEAKNAEAQIRRIETESPAACNGCTVSAAELISSSGMK
jgi:tetratricopeptide (TPR) repeat protein